MGLVIWEQMHFISSIGWLVQGKNCGKSSHSEALARAIPLI